MARSTARKRALNTLYEADEKGQDILSLLAERIEHPGAQTPLPDYAIEIVRGVADHRADIDGVLNLRSTSWKVGRMAVVDRNILRIGAWEILFNDDVPDKVAIDEALTLAKSFSDADAPGFIHGLLSAVCSEEKPLREARRAREEAEAMAQTDGETETETAVANDQTSEAGPSDADADADARTAAAVADAQPAQDPSAPAGTADEASADDGDHAA